MRAPHFRNRPAAVAGFLGIAGNIFGVLFLREVPSAYRLDKLGAWAEEAIMHPVASAASACSFVLGLVALAVWADSFASTTDHHLGRTGARVLTWGALFNAAGSIAPLVWAIPVGGRGMASEDLGRAVLGAALALDASFNLALGVGLICMAVSWSDAGWSKTKDSKLRVLAAVAGVLTLPACAQAVFDPAALMIYVASPFWLLFIAITSVRAWRSDVSVP